MNTNTNTKTVKKNTKNANKKTVAPTLTPRQLVAQKNGSRLGKPPGTTSTGLVTLKTLIASLPETAQVPVGMKFLRLLNIPVESSFVSTVQNLKQVVNSTKSQTSSVEVIDLNPVPA